ncbi:MAG TPA: GAF domain-containing protein [Gaiellaceae bacterium]|nr:GAF domain-containing protein [Gaiellaceae bacterium]
MIARDQISADEGVRFLAEAGQTLARSLDWEETLVQVARLAVPALADWCIVDVLEEDGVTIKQVAVAAVDPRKEDLLRAMRTLYQPTIDSPQPAAQTLRTGEPVVFEEFDPESLAATTRDERHYELMLELDPRSTVAIPLIARARTLGALTLSWSESGRRYTEPQIVLATELARRAALAVDNAILFSREREARAIAEEAAARLRELEVISEAALTHLDLNRLLANLLDGVRTIMRADTSVILLLDESGDELVASWSRGLEEEVEARVRVPVGKGFAGRVAATRSPVFIPDVRRAEVVNPLLVKRGLIALLGVPLLVEGRLLGVLHVGSTRARTFTKDDERTLQLLADRIALAIEQSRLYESERAASRRLEFLAEASELLGSTLDYTTALSGLVDLVVPALADWCVVDMLRDRRLERVAVAHVDPELHSAAYEFHERFPPNPDSPHGPARAVATGAAELIRDVTDEHLQAASAGDEHLLEALRAIGMTSLICAPLVARGRVLGAITLLSDREDRRYDTADLVTAEEVARRAAVAVDNALLFAEAERRADAARVLEHIGDGVFMLDREGVVRLWNRAAETVTGLSAESVVGRRAADAVPGWSAIEASIPVAEAPTPAAVAETLPLGLPEREVWLSIAAVAFAEGTVYAFRDLTADRALEELRSDFVSTVSHELRTPLAAIYGAALTLQREDLPLDESQRANLLAIISTESDRLARTVNDILWASRLDAQRVRLDVGTHDPRELARTVVEAAQVHAPRNVRLRFTCEADLPPILGDPDKVRQVLTNFVDNAVKYSPDGGTVELSLSRRDHAVLFTVSDEGLGIPSSDQRRIFDKFYRVDPNLTRGVGGTGLGLYISRELVRRMNGTIWVESREGEGSRFSFELPVATG